MALLRSIKRAGGRLLSAGQKRWRRRYQRRYDRDMSFIEAAARYPEQNDLYWYMYHYYHHLLTPPVRDHREYFKRGQRGFGEDAFHAMWWLLMREFRPRRCVEIGVYRGQSISLWALVAKQLGFECDVHGISPFAPIGDAVSAYRDDLDYLADTLSAFAHFELPEPCLVRALSTEAAATTHIRSRKWDLVFIDGSHDYEIVVADYKLCRSSLAQGGLLVIDDSALGTSFRPPRFSFAGHPGPSSVANEIAARELDLLAAVGHSSVFIHKTQ